MFSGFNTDLTAWRDANGEASWFTRFLNYLKSHGRMSDLAFMSFEHYPFKACDQGDALQDDLLREPALVRDMVRIFRVRRASEQASRSLSPNRTSPPTAPPSRSGSKARLDRRLYRLGAFLRHSGARIIKPKPNRSGSTSAAARGVRTANVIVGEDYRIVAKAAAYYAAQMLMQEWLGPGNSPVELYPVSSNLGDDRPEVSAYAARVTGGAWSLLLVNKDWVARPLSRRAVER